LPFLISGIITGISIYAIISSFPLPTPPPISAYRGAQFPSEELFEYFFAVFRAITMIYSLSSLVSLIVVTTTTGVVIKNASDQIEKGTSNLGDSFNFAISKLPSLLVAQFVTGILAVIGMLLFIVPGIIIAIMFSLVIPAIIVEQKGAFESLGRSKKLVSNRWLKTFTLLLVFGIIAIILGGIMFVLAMLFSASYPIVNPLIMSIMSAFVAPFSSIAITYLYYAMVAREIPPPPPPPPPPTL